MYNVSQEYKEALYNKVIRNDVYLDITLKNGESRRLNEDFIIPNSLSVNNKCVSGSDFCVGSVYTGEMNVSLLWEGPGENYIYFYDAEIVVGYLLEMEGKTEEIPIGKFFVDEATQSTKILTLKCYDAMYKFDETIEEDAFGTPLELSEFICEKCGVNLSDNAKDKLTHTTNSNYDFSLYSEKLSTYRDALSNIATVTGGFFTIDRIGNLDFRNFHMTNEVEIISSRKISTKTQNYKTYFKGVTARFFADQNDYPYEYIDSSKSDGLILDLGDIPIVAGLDSVKHEIIENIYNEIDGLEYYPCDITCVTDPSIDLGDIVKHTDKYIAYEPQVIKSLVTGYTWRFRGKMDVKSVGSNPRLNIKTKLEKQIEQGTGGNGSKLIVHSYTNAQEIKVKNNYEEIIRINYATKEECKPIFIATIPLELENDAYISFDFYMDEILMDNGNLVKYFPSGKQFVTLSRYFVDEANKRHTLKIKMQTVETITESRRHKASIATINNYIEAAQANPTETVTYNTVVPDSSYPTITIEQEAIKAVLFSDGISGESKWDGTLSFVEKMGITTGISQITSLCFESECNAKNERPYRSAFEEAFGTSSIFSATTSGMTISGGVNDVVKSYTMQTSKANRYYYDSDYVDISSGKFKLNETYKYTSVPSEIDEGYLTVVEIVTEDKQAVESVVVV